MYGSYGIYTERKGFAVTLWYGGAFASTLDFQFCHDNPSKQSHQKGIQVVVSNMSYFHPYLGRWSSLTNMFQMGWFNHQLYRKISGTRQFFPQVSAFSPGGETPIGQSTHQKRALAEEVPARKLNGSNGVAKGVTVSRFSTSWAKKSHQLFQ